MRNGFHSTMSYLIAAIPAQAHIPGPVEPVGAGRANARPIFRRTLYHSFISYYHTPKIMKFIPHMWAGKSLQWILMRLPDQCFFASAGPAYMYMCTCTHTRKQLTVGVEFCEHKLLVVWVYPILIRPPPDNQHAECCSLQLQTFSGSTRMPLSPAGYGE